MVIWTKFELSIKKRWSDINFWSVIQNGTFFLKIFIHPQSESLIQKMRLQESIKFWLFWMKKIRRYQDFVLFLVYIVFIINIFLQRCSTWRVRHSYCTTPLYCQYFPNLKINYKKSLHLCWSFMCLHCWCISWIGFAVICGLRD